ncbi:MAG: hypothetical protein SR3Q1_01510 [Quinella sp. 3Q1]|nr:hypothetical protein [Quinella sp. 3Q1]
MGAIYIFHPHGFCIASLCGFFRHVQKSGLIWKYDLRFPSTWILSNEQKNACAGRFGRLKVILSDETCFEGDFWARFTFSTHMEFVSRHNAVFSARTKIESDLEVRFTFSFYVDFVKRAKKMPTREDLDV